ncbi:MAG: hypothetical protein OEW35_07300 [Gammaproteobacteria bacterium]|nr:hypothetical protein [Gammaproteobacteria bacterium]MDH4254702.1 hypothetical protein [Gammaproteobacteria bacterium]MDH5308805.1 hypothetical protein [Gammaproteobacteria bacterium]
MLKSLLAATLAAFLMLLIVNAFVFPLVFGSGVPLPYSNLRPEPLFVFNIAALAATALLLSLVCRQAGATTASGASTLCALCGLLTAMPSALHTLSLVDIAPAAQIAPVAWTVFTWGIAGSPVGLMLRRYGPPDA